jgi:hypothetical protein
MKKLSSPLMRKKNALIKSFAPDQIALSYFLSETNRTVGIFERGTLLYARFKRSGNLSLATAAL